MWITLSGKDAQLSNKGGIITLLDRKGLKVDGVSYTKKEASGSGRLWCFSRLWSLVRCLVRCWRGRSGTR